MSTTVFPPGAAVFVDESKARGFILAASHLTVNSDTQTVRAIQALVRRGQRRIHFKSESDASRRRILSALSALPLATRVYQIAGTPDRSARARCLEALVDDLAASRAARLVIERDASIERNDRRTIRTQLERSGNRDLLTYSHCAPHEEPLLWVSDAVAWCRQANGDWQRRAAPLVSGITRLP